MADCKKYNGSTWEHSLRKLTTATDTFTTLPAAIYADGNNATVGLKGNTVQNGTPTPDNPIMPQGAGEMTKNLFDKSQTFIAGYYDDNGELHIQTGTNATEHTELISTDGITTFTIKGLWNYDTGLSAFAVYEWDSSKNWLRRSNRTIDIKENIPITFNIGTDTHYISLQVMTKSSGFTYDNTMLNTGSTPLPYEPYGYKIPISSANTTTPVYLGEVQTERKIKKLVLTGEEIITFASEDDNRMVGFFTIPNMGMKSSETGYCNILQWKSSYSQSEYNRILANGSTRFYMSIAKSALPEPTFEGFIAYLAAQYSAGTPVTVWYVLANEETGIVNEPLRKIGSYADSISGITIPTITGKDSFDVLTTLKPSEVELTYTGWHDASVKEWDGSEWQ